MLTNITNSWITIGFIIFITLLCIGYTIYSVKNLYTVGNGNIRLEEHILLSSSVNFFSIIVTFIIYFIFRTRNDFGFQQCDSPLKSERSCNLVQNCKKFSNPICGADASVGTDETCPNNIIALPEITFSGTSVVDEILYLNIYRGTEIESFLTKFIYDETSIPDAAGCVGLGDYTTEDGISTGYCAYDAGVSIYIPSEYIQNDDGKSMILETMAQAYTYSGRGVSEGNNDIIDNFSTGTSFSYVINDKNSLYFFTGKNNNSKNSNLINFGISSSATRTSIFENFNLVRDNQIINWNLDSKTVYTDDDRFSVYYSAKSIGVSNYNDWRKKPSIERNDIQNFSKIFPCIEPGYSYPSCDQYSWINPLGGVRAHCIPTADGTTPDSKDCVPACFDPINYGNTEWEDVRKFETTTGRIVGNKNVGNPVFPISGDAGVEDLKIKYQMPTDSNGSQSAVCESEGLNNGIGGCDKDQPLNPLTSGNTVYPQTNIMCSTQNYRDGDTNAPFKFNKLADAYEKGSGADLQVDTYPNIVNAINGTLVDPIILGFN